MTSLNDGGSGTPEGTPDKQAILKKYICTVCLNTYDPEKGDPEGKIASGVPFESLPRTWCCPQCKAPKDAYKREGLPLWLG